MVSLFRRNSPHLEDQIGSRLKAKPVAIQTRTGWVNTSGCPNDPHRSPRSGGPASTALTVSEPVRRRERYGSL
jgi:hypothetical protein